MKIIIAGSRNFKDYQIAKSFIYDTLHKWFHAHLTSNVIIGHQIVSGGAIGADALGEVYACENDLKIVRFLPDWNKHGKSAGPIRNKEMAEYADALIAFWDGESKGTKNMIDCMKNLNKPVEVYLSYN